MLDVCRRRELGMRRMWLLLPHCPLLNYDHLLPKKKRTHTSLKSRYATEEEKFVPVHYSAPSLRSVV